MKTSKIILFAVIFSLFLMSSIALSQDNSSTLYVDDDGTQDYASIPVSYTHLTLPTN